VKATFKSLAELRDTGKSGVEAVCPDCAIAREVWCWGGCISRFSVGWERLEGRLVGCVDNINPVGAD
jgi:hypothetical protein